MGKVKKGLENVGGVLDILNDTYNTFDKGVNTIEGIKSGKVSENYKKARLIEERTQSMKRKFYIFWLAMIVITALMLILL